MRDGKCEPLSRAACWCRVAGHAQRVGHSKLDSEHASPCDGFTDPLLRGGQKRNLEATRLRLVLDTSASPSVLQVSYHGV